MLTQVNSRQVAEAAPRLEAFAEHPHRPPHPPTGPLLELLCPRRRPQSVESTPRLMSWVSEESHVLLCQGVQPDTSHGTQTHRCSQAVRPLGSCERHRQKPKLLLVIFRAALAGCGGFGSAPGLKFGLHQAGGPGQARPHPHDARIRRSGVVSLERGGKAVRHENEN